MPLGIIRMLQQCSGGYWQPENSVKIGIYPDVDNDVDNGIQDLEAPTESSW